MFLFEGEVEPWLPALLAQIDGRPRGEISVPGAGAAEVDAALRRLAEAGLLDDAPEPRRGSVTLVGESPLWPWLRRILAAEVREDGEVAVVHAETLAPSALSAFNRRRIGERRPWLLLSLQTAWARVGPLFVPGETACAECYGARLASNRAKARTSELMAVRGMPLNFTCTPPNLVG